MVNSVQKGKRGEREFCKFLEKFNLRYRRSQQYAGNVGDSDVVPCDDIEDDESRELTLAFDKAYHFEVKRYASMPTIATLDKMYTNQAVVEAAKREKKAILAIKPDRGHWMFYIKPNGFSMLADAEGYLNHLIWSEFHPTTFAYFREKY